MILNFVIGLIISILLTYWGIWHANKNKTKAQLSLIDQNWIPLITTFAENFKTIELANYKLPFNTNQYYYRGTIINTGNTDIYKSIILKPLKISFPDGFKIVNFKLDQKNLELDLEFKQENDSIIFQWDILKPLENFTFELIIESTQNFNIYELRDKIKVDSRIADLKSIERLTIWDLKNLKKKFLSESLPTYLGLLLFYSLPLFGVYYGISSFYKEVAKFDYSIQYTKSKQPVELEYYNSDSLKLKHDKIVEIIARKDLNDKVSIVTEITIHKNLYLLTILCIILIMLISLRTISLVKENIRDAQLKKIFQSL